LPYQWEKPENAGPMLQDDDPKLKLSDPLPPEIDWRTKNAVTEVKNQRMHSF
jgi:hypothetical protein